MTGLIGALLGLGGGILITFTCILPWGATFIPDQSDWGDKALAIGLGILVFIIGVFVIGAISLYMFCPLLNYLGNYDDEDTAPLLTGITGMFCILGGAACSLLVSGHYSAGDDGRLSFCAGLSILTCLFLTAFGSLLGVFIDKRIVNHFRLKRKAINEQKSQLIAMINEAFEDKGK